MGITYEDIKKANDAIEPTDIKGKGYAEVNQRIKAFRMLYPTGTISTELVSNENGVCIFRATISFENEGNVCILGTGTAYEKEGSTFINKTSYIENCETSAVGRALGMAGLGIDTSVASAEEVKNAIANQEKDDPKARAAKLKQVNDWIAAIRKECEKKGTTTDNVFSKVNLDDPKKLTKELYESIMRRLAMSPDVA